MQRTRSVFRWLWWDDDAYTHTHVYIYIYIQTPAHNERAINAMRAWKSGRSNKGKRDIHRLHTTKSKRYQNVCTGDKMTKPKEIEYTNWPWWRLYCWSRTFVRQHHRLFRAKASESVIASYIFGIILSAGYAHDFSNIFIGFVFTENDVDCCCWCCFFFSIAIIFQTPLERRESAKQ